LQETGVTVDPRTPVIVGVGQRTQRVDRGEPALEPVDLIAEALRVAQADSGAGAAVVEGADSVRVVSLLSWRYRDPGALVAARIGAAPRDTALTSMGGNSPQSLVNETCLDIQAGRNDLVLIGGAEAWRTRMAGRTTDVRPDWTVQGDDVPVARAIGTELHMSHPGELSRGVVMPVQVYPLFEQALRHRLGRTLDEHLVAVSELWARFSEVAANNPYSWIRDAMTAEAIRTPSPDNRWIGFPYTKVMNSNNAVEQGAALVLCSAERATELGVPRDRWVFPLAGTDAHDHYFVSERDDLASSPAIREAGRALFAISGLGIDDVAHVDLYSCFPSAVQIAARELGLAVDRQLTVTGGMSFAGGPWNNYVTHSIATMVDVLRDDPGSVGLCTANGGFITKHALGLYSTTPPTGGFRWATPQDEVDALPRRELCTEHDGEIVVESWTVMHGRDGAPENGIVVGLIDDGRRAWGTTQDATALEQMLSDELIGTRAKLSPDGAASI
jgi:acetyl-CoA C-acetyltransferase